MSNKKYFEGSKVEYEIINQTNEKETQMKLRNAEELLKNLYQWLLSNDDLEGEMEEEYAIRVIREISSTKKLINKYFRENN
tara:strand:- start:322 stop:564 length:243 start_codon:yes stop_codon:yes gene_type:complete